MTVPAAGEPWPPTAAAIAAAAPTSCSQCGQRTPVCAECGASIIYVPKSGWGQGGEWRHLAPVDLRHQSGHMARPKLFITPPKSHDACPEKCSLDCPSPVIDDKEFTEPVDESWGEP